MRQIVPFVLYAFKLLVVCVVQVQFTDLNFAPKHFELSASIYVLLLFSFMAKLKLSVILTSQRKSFLVFQDRKQKTLP